VLLERGARTVLAVDVGHDQLATSIREDGRVIAVEGCNVRDLTPDSLAAETGVDEPPALIVGDLSFISLELVLPALAGVAAPDARFVLLVKPQFEVGRLGVSGGIVTDPELAADAVARVIRSAAELGLTCRGVEASPISGEHGNREVLAHFVREDRADQTEWSEAIRELLGAGGGA
jgi:23S rRNA (cytidine1920-2'-O)/16S rRNA (cytidine1409-2'-O)-methyltransferase